MAGFRTLYDPGQLLRLETFWGPAPIIAARLGLPPRPGPPLCGARYMAVDGGAMLGVSQPVCPHAVRPAAWIWPRRAGGPASRRCPTMFAVLLGP